MRDSTKALLIIGLAIGISIAAIAAIAMYPRPMLACLCFSTNSNQETIVLESYAVTSSTNVTLTIKNTGSLTVGLVYYTVKDANGAQYASSNWAGPVISPNQIVSANVFIDGKSFTFETGPSYTITVVTSRNNIFTFTIT